MKQIRIKSLLTLGVVALLSSSCNDWLTLYPQNKVTEEQFWEDMNDLNGVRYAAYRSFASGDMVERILNWGEVRSDNFVHSTYSNSPNWQYYEDIINGRLDTACTFFDWSGVYTTINYCNKVLERGEEVLEKDKQFTRSQWNSIKAEMITLRALNYFYLLRAFSDVPYVTTSIDTDAQVTSIPQTPMLDVLNSLIADVLTIESGYAVTNWANSQDTKSTITQPAVDALLADMYLWRASYLEGCERMDEANADYREAVKYARLSREALDQQTENAKAQGSTSTLSSNEKDKGKYLLLQNFTDVADNKTLNFGAFRSIFNQGYSDESIFEMAFTATDKVESGVLNSFFGIVNSSSKIRFTSNAPEIFSVAAPQCKTGASGLSGTVDIRMFYNSAYTDAVRFVQRNTSSSSSMEVNPDGFVMKYRDLSSSSSSYIYEIQSNQLFNLFLSFSEEKFRNFIIYRKSDVLLIEAEALAALNEQLDVVADIIYELRKRSSMQMAELTVPKYTTRDDALKAVMNERQLELYAEGKRWFDLVRWAERNQGKYKGQLQNAEYNLFKEFFRGSKQQTAQSRLKTRWSLYNPVYYYEREVSGYTLRQNPYWDDDLTTN